MIEGPILDVEVIGFLVCFAVAMPHSHSNGPPFSKHQKNFFSSYYKAWKYYETLAFNCAKQVLVCLNKVAICNCCNADKSMFPDIMNDTYPYLGLRTEHFQSYICEVSMLD